MSTSPMPGSDAVVRPQVISRARQRIATFRDAIKVHGELAEREPFLAKLIQVEMKEAIQRFMEHIGPLLPIELMGLRHEIINITALVYEAVSLGFREMLDGGTESSASSGS